MSARGKRFGVRVFTWPTSGQLLTEERMAIAGLIVTLAGFLLAVSSIGISDSNGVRLVMVLVGIAVSLGGIMGLINPAYQQNAAWKR